MSTSLTPEQVTEQALREKAEQEAQVKYLQSQLGKMMKEKKRVSTFKRDLFSWLILFQPELEEEEEVIA